VNVTLVPEAIDTPLKVRTQPDKLVPGPVNAVHAKEPPVASETVTVNEPERVASAVPKFVKLAVYTVTPETTPWVGVPVGVFVYPNSESFRIGLRTVTEHEAGGVVTDCPKPFVPVAVALSEIIVPSASEVVTGVVRLSVCEAPGAKGPVKSGLGPKRTVFVCVSTTLRDVLPVLVTVHANVTVSPAIAKTRLTTLPFWSRIVCAQVHVRPIVGRKFTNVTVGPMALCACVNVRMAPTGLLGSGFVPETRLDWGTTSVPMFT